MKNIDYKWFIIIGLVIALGLTIFFTSRYVEQGNDKLEKKIAILNDSINFKNGKLAVYKVDQRELQKQIIVKQEEIVEELEKEILKMIKYEEE